MHFLCYTTCKAAATPGVGSAIFTGPNPVMPVWIFARLGANLLLVAVCLALQTKFSHDRFAYIGPPIVAVSPITLSNRVHSLTSNNGVK